jgi:hypothetical protein
VKVVLLVVVLLVVVLLVAPGTGNFKGTAFAQPVENTTDSNMIEQPLRNDETRI